MLAFPSSRHRPPLLRSVTLDSARSQLYERYLSQLVPLVDRTRIPPAESGGQAEFAAFLRSQLIGSERALPGPFGARQLVYADWVASGRSLHFVEDWIRQHVLPHYANTHTSASFTGLKTSLLRQQARALIASACACSSDDCVLFAGSGCTAAYALLLRLLQHRLTAQGGSAVFVLGPYHHHSITLPARESGHELVDVPEDESTGGPDLAVLDATLSRLAADGRYGLRVGVFSAASNVSGITCDTAAVTRLLHRHGFLAVWDYAAASCFHDIVMSPEGDEAAAKDAVILSPHKLLGGPNTPGILLVKRVLASNRVPCTPGGGTVFLVTDRSHTYTANTEEREEAGTPDIVGAIRAALCFQLKQHWDTAWKAARLEDIKRRLVDRVARHPAVVLAGNPHAPRLPILTFLIRPAGSSRVLHPGFVASLLNDLFGIQCRAGCMCACPYAFSCLGLSSEAQRELEQLLLRESCLLLKPGFTRLSAHLAISDEELELLAAAVLFVAEHGLSFLSRYCTHARSAVWTVEGRQKLDMFTGSSWLTDLPLTAQALRRQRPLAADSADRPPAGEALIEANRRLLATCGPKQPAATALDIGLSEEAETLRWFLLPEDLDWHQGMDGLQTAKVRHCNRACMIYPPTF